MNRDLIEGNRMQFRGKAQARRVGMPGVVGSDRHMQPMVHHLDAGRAELWFIAAASSDLVRDAGLGARAHYCIVAPEGDFCACLAGTLEQIADRAKLDALWSPAGSAWFEGGREDPDVILLRLALHEAAVWATRLGDPSGRPVWATTDSRLEYGFEIARSNIDRRHVPEVAEHLIVRFGG